MHRIEIVGLFTAIKVLTDKNDMDGIREIVDSVLEEARFKKVDSKKSEQKNKEE
jgi:hypothetical protein